GVTDAAVVLPPEPPLNGSTESPISGLIALTGRPNVSPATTATIVRVPVPMSCVPHFTTTLPSDRMSTWAREPRPAPPQRCADTPMPVLIGPGAGSPPVGWRLSQPNRFAPSSKYFAHIAFGPAGGRVFTRNATGSIFTRSASSSLPISVRQQP